MKDVSIILVNYNTLALTDGCIASIRTFTKGVDYEIILVDNASTDGSREHFEEMEGLEYIYLPENLGFGKANNAGLEKATGRNVLFLNSDTYLLCDAISEMSRFLDSHSEAAACGSNLVKADKSPNQSFERVFPSVWSEFDAFFEYIPSRLRFGRSRCYNHSSKPMEVAMVSGADLMVRHECLDAVGGAFDPRFFMYYEDTELCWRLRSKGWSIWVLPLAGIVHLGGASTPGAAQGYGVAQKKRKLESLRLYLEATEQEKLYDRIIAWKKAQASSRCLIHCFNKARRDKWKAYKEMY